eukprot:5192314-Prymnesium_polylepis.1
MSPTRLVFTVNTVQIKMRAKIEFHRRHFRKVRTAIAQAVAKSTPGSGWDPAAAKMWPYPAASRAGYLRQLSAKPSAS